MTRSRDGPQAKAIRAEGHGQSERSVILVTARPSREMPCEARSRDTRRESVVESKVGRVLRIHDRSSAIFGVPGGQSQV